MSGVAPVAAPAATGAAQPREAIPPRSAVSKQTDNESVTTGLLRLRHPGRRVRQPGLPVTRFKLRGTRDVAVGAVAQIAVNLPVDVVADGVNAAVAVGHVDAAGVGGAEALMPPNVRGILWCIQKRS